MEILLISDDLFRQCSPVKEEFAIQTFIPYIALAQKLYINDILGAPLLTELQNQIKEATESPDAAPYPITEYNRTLLSMIAPPLSFYAVYQGLPFHWAAILNKGVTLRESENSKAVDINDIAQLKRWLKDDAEVLLRQLIDYLCSCKKNFPLWNSQGYCNSAGGAVFDINDCGIYIPNR